MHKLTFNYIKFREVNSFNLIIYHISTIYHNLDYKNKYALHKKIYGEKNKLYYTYIQNRNKGIVNKSLISEKIYMKRLDNKLIKKFKEYNKLNYGVGI